MLARMYISTRPIVIAFAQEKNTSVTPKIRTHTNATTCMPTSTWMALSGVFRFGLTLPSAAGSTPERPIAEPARSRRVEAGEGEGNHDHDFDGAGDDQRPLRYRDPVVGEIDHQCQAGYYP